MGKGLWEPEKPLNAREEESPVTSSVDLSLFCAHPSLYSGHQPAAKASAADEDPAAGRTQGEATKEETPSGSSQRSSCTSTAWSP